MYPHSVTKVEKGRSQAELDQVIDWLTGFDQAALGQDLEGETVSEGATGSGLVMRPAESDSGVVDPMR